METYKTFVCWGFFASTAGVLTQSVCVLAAELKREQLTMSSMNGILNKCGLLPESLLLVILSANQ